MGTRALTSFLFGIEPTDAATLAVVMELPGAVAAPLYRRKSPCAPSITVPPGFDPPEEHRRLYDVMDRRVNTDPTLATQTRRGTGYYKVPSLKGVWYRGPFEHNGSVATLEDWFDPARREEGYVPTGLAPWDGSPRPVPGHAFGLRLREEDRAALIAFLRTEAGPSRRSELPPSLQPPPGGSREGWRSVLTGCRSRPGTTMGPGRGRADGAMSSGGGSALP